MHFFSTKRILSYVVIALIAIFHLGFIVNETDFIPNGSFINSGVFNNVNVSYFVLNIGGSILGGVILTIVFNRFVSINKRTLMPGFVYFVLSLINIPFGFNYYLITNLLIAFSIFNLFSIHPRDNAIKKAFNSSLLIGFSAIIFPLNFLFVIPIIVGITAVRIASWKEIVAVLVGVFLPFAYVLAFDYIVQSNSFNNIIKATLNTSETQLNINADYLIAVICIILFIIAISSIVKVLKKLSIQEKRNINISISFLVISIVIASAVFFTQGFSFTFIIIAVPLSVVFSFGYNQLSTFYQIITVIVLTLLPVLKILINT